MNSKDNKIFLTRNETDKLYELMNEYNNQKGFTLIQAHTGIGPSLILRIYNDDNNTIEIDITDYDSW